MSSGQLEVFNGISLECESDGAMFRILGMFDPFRLSRLRYGSFWFPFDSLGAGGAGKFIEILGLMTDLECLDLKSNQDWPAEFFEGILTHCKGLKYLCLHDARLNIGCLVRIRCLLATSLRELQVTCCGPGRRSPSSVRFREELESLREFIRMNAHNLHIYSFVDGDESSLCAPLGVSESNSVFLEASKNPWGSNETYFDESQTFEESFTETVNKFYATLDSNRSLSVPVYIDAKGRLKVLQNWGHFSSLHDEIEAFCLIKMPVNLIKRAGHLAIVQLIDRTEKFVVGCNCIEPSIDVSCCLALVSEQLTPGCIVEISNDHLRDYHVSLERNCGALTGTSLGCFLKIDPDTHSVAIASLTSATARLTNSQGAFLHEDDPLATISRVYYEVAYVPLTAVFVSKYIIFIILYF